jgi:hypothetical protein
MAKQKMTFRTTEVTGGNGHWKWEVLNAYGRVLALGVEGSRSTARQAAREWITKTKGSTDDYE